MKRTCASCEAGLFTWMPIPSIIPSTLVPLVLFFSHIRFICICLIIFFSSSARVYQGHVFRKWSNHHLILIDIVIIMSSIKMKTVLVGLEGGKNELYALACATARFVVWFFSFALFWDFIIIPRKMFSQRCLDTRSINLPPKIERTKKNEKSEREKANEKNRKTVNSWWKT